MSSERTNSIRITKNISAFKQAFLDNLIFTSGTTLQSASKRDIYNTLAYTVRDHLMNRWRETTEAHFATNPKFIYYLSAEYLLGRQLPQNLLYTETTEIARQVFTELGLDLDDILAYDAEPGLGNGGLGRLAACFLDSLATMDMPCVGYGIRYEFGIFRQSFQDGWQEESPDDWLFYNNPWEFAQPDDMVEVQFGGHTESYVDKNGRYRSRWLPAYKLLGEPYHMMVPGYNTQTVNILRLWRARADNEFNLQLFDVGDYARAVEQKTYVENVTKVLYPNDNNPQGKELRLKQQYFFVACSLRDIIRRFRFRNERWDAFPDKVVIQLNDTHPVIAIPELMRLMVDVYGQEWDFAWDITRRTFAYTCHTLLPEALEKWPISLFGRVLPRHLEIIYEINRRFLDEARLRFPGDEWRIGRLSLIEEGNEKQIRMANLACVGSFSVNGVAELHSRLLAERTLHDFAMLWPEKFNNKTNGVTPRRFVKMSNPRLSALISSKVGNGWLTDLDQLAGLEAWVEDADFRHAWQQVKRANKAALADIILARHGLQINPDSIFDVMVKRLHEYKRQLLQALHIITLYNRLKANPAHDVVPRTFIFGAKAAPGYYMAKLIIKLINEVAAMINQDADVNGRYQVIFLENFNVSLAEHVYPAANLSEQISLAGKEASGTGNMKFALNGALTIGTLDGANIEIRERVGAENFFLFGLTTEEVFAVKGNGYKPYDYYQRSPELRQAIDQIASGYFSSGDRNLFRPLVDHLLSHDEFMLLADYDAFIARQEEVTAVYGDPERWTRMSIRNVARCGFFSSDRSMRQYCDDIWRVQKVAVGG